MIFDLHCDTIDKLISTNSSLKSNNLAVDIEKMQKVNAKGQFFALYMSLKIIDNPFKKSLEIIDNFYNEIEKYDDIKIAKSYKEFLENDNKGTISSFLAIEEGGILEGSLVNLRTLYRLGVRMITLTWNFENQLAYPNTTDKYREKGLKDFGIQVVREMNRLGMLIDVSHMSDQGVYDVAKYSSMPFIASHSNSRSICNHHRNLSDDIIKLIGNNSGVIGVNFEKAFLNSEKKGSIDDIIKHIEYIINIAGEDSIGIGTDFDGISTKGLEIDNIGDIEKLSERLNFKGFSYDLIEKIFYKNALRVIKEVIK